MTTVFKNKNRENIMNWTWSEKIDIEISKEITYFITSKENQNTKRLFKVSIR